MELVSIEVSVPGIGRQRLHWSRPNWRPYLTNRACSSGLRFRRGRGSPRLSGGSGFVAPRAEDVRGRIAPGHADEGVGEGVVPTFSRILPGPPKI